MPGVNVGVGSAPVAYGYPAAASTQDVGLMQDVENDLYADRPVHGRVSILGTPAEDLSNKTAYNEMQVTYPIDGPTDTGVVVME